MATLPLTKKNIERKLNRKHNPVTNMAELAREFGYSTSVRRWDWGARKMSKDTSSTAPASFRRKVKALVGEKAYHKIRDDRFVNHIYQ